MLRFVIWFTGLLLTVATTAASAVASEARPRLVVLICVDDLRPALGSYDDPRARTPHLDAFAARSVQFDQAYVQQAVCSPSRMSMLSGLRPETIGILDLKERFRDRDPLTQTLPALMQAAGYRTVSLGKIYHHEDDDAEHFDVRQRFYDDRYFEPANIAIHGGEHRPATRPWMTPGVYRAAAWEAPDVADEAYEDGEMTSHAIGMLAEVSAEQPMFLAIGYRRPHLPFNAPRRYWDALDGVDFTVPVPTPIVGAPDWALTNWGELRGYHGIPRRGDLEPGLTRDLNQAYYACVAYVDAQIGRLLAAIEAHGLADDAVVVLWGDHGFKLGDYGDWCKHTNLTIDTRVPVLIHAPGVAGGMAPGRRTTPVEVLDLYPTISELVTGGVPEHCQGQSLVPLLRDPTAVADGYAMSVYPKRRHLGFSITDGAYRYTAWYPPGADQPAVEEFYDHRSGPLATENQIANEAFVAEVERLRSAVQQRRVQALDRR